MWLLLLLLQYWVMRCRVNWYYRTSIIVPSHHIALHCIALHCTVLHYIILICGSLYYIISHDKLRLPHRTLPFFSYITSYTFYHFESLHIVFPVFLSFLSYSFLNSSFSLFHFFSYSPILFFSFLSFSSTLLPHL